MDSCSCSLLHFPIIISFHFQNIYHYIGMIIIFQMDIYELLIALSQMGIQKLLIPLSQMSIHELLTVHLK